jgi:hypothetical protein
MRTAKKPRQYVTEHILGEALRAKQMDKLSYRVQISPSVSLTFGYSGVSLNKCFKESKAYKWVNNWSEITVDEINRAFAEQEWEVCY